jgi:hypothetical protein
MNPSDRDEIVREIHRLQRLLDQVQDHLSALATSADQDERARDVLTRASVDEAYAELEIAKRIPTADAWQAIRKATAAVGRLGPDLPEDGATRRSYPWPAVRLTLFVSASAASLSALRVVQDVARQLGPRVSFEVCDVSRDPDRAERAGVVFAPVLRIERAGHDPVAIFGGLDHRERLLERLVGAGLPAGEDGAGETSGHGARTTAGGDPLSGGLPRADTD